MRKAVERAMKHQYEPYDDQVDLHQHGIKNTPTTSRKETTNYIVVSRMDGTFSIVRAWSTGGYEEVAFTTSRLNADSIARTLNDAGR